MSWFWGSKAAAAPAAPDAEGAGSDAASTATPPPTPAAQPSKWDMLTPLTRPSLTAAQQEEQAAFQEELRFHYAGEGDAEAREWALANSVRYFRAYGGREQAFPHITATVAWRKEFFEPNFHCKHCHSKDSYHAFINVGKDKFRRPILYAAMAKTTLEPAE